MVTTGPVAAETPPAEFLAALASLRSAQVREEAVIEESPAPRRVAPYAAAFEASVAIDDPGSATPPPVSRPAAASGPGTPSSEALASGRFVLLYDPDGHPAWQGRLRVVTFVRANVEHDLATDPLLTEVAWTWLREALVGRQARFHALGGTVTRAVSEGFGALTDQTTQSDVEIRASWTVPADPDGVGPDLSGHLGAWVDLLCQAGGLPPSPSGVRTLAVTPVAAEHAKPVQDPPRSDRPAPQ
ncbi:MAG: DUF3000 domain-containing protein [Actinomycetes bacterium]